jgi:hypothetical protein
MNEMNDERFQEMLKRAMAPMQDAELKHDLWPRMLRRLDERPSHALWLDWALLAVLAIWCAVFPSAIPVLLYNL